MCDDVWGIWRGAGAGVLRIAARAGFGSRIARRLHEDFLSGLSRNLTASIRPEHRIESQDSAAPAGGGGVSGSGAGGEIRDRNRGMWERGLWQRWPDSSRPRPGKAADEVDQIDMVHIGAAAVDIDRGTRRDAGRTGFIVTVPPRNFGGLGKFGGGLAGPFAGCTHDRHVQRRR